VQRNHLDLTPAAPNPSVEALPARVSIPHKFVDHTHSTAVLPEPDTQDGDTPLCREVFGKRVGYVP